MNLDGPCPGSGWAPDFSLHPDWTAFALAVQTYATNLAIRVLWAATGRQYGYCAVTVRPCQRSQLPAYLTYPALFSPWGNNGFAWNWGLVGLPGGGSTQLVNQACCGGMCGCGAADIALPGPLDSITNVTIDGAVLTPTAYRLDGNRLTRQDGQSWPISQDFNQPIGNVNTWSVTYPRGQAVPVEVNAAAGELAYQVAKAHTGQACLLPLKATSVTRNGVSVQLLNVSDFLTKGLTGLYDVDAVILACNPHGAKAPPRVISPDLPVFR